MYDALMLRHAAEQLSGIAITTATNIAIFTHDIGGLLNSRVGMSGTTVTLSVEI